MLKTLIKKQLLEINKTFFKSNKKGSKKISTIKIIVFTLLMIFVSVIFVIPAINLMKNLSNTELEWFYFTIMGGIAIMFGVFGSVFNTYASLYKSKDNELLLSMPIPTKYIVLARISGVYLMGLLYSSVVMLPTLVIYFIYAKITILNIIGSFLLYIMITLVVLILSCILGYLVARLTSKLKNKSIMTVVFSLIFMALYYFVYFKASEILQNILTNGETYAKNIKIYAYPLYAMGKMGTGDIISLLAFSGIVIGILLLVIYILNRSFLKITTISDNTKKAKQIKEVKKSNSMSVALLKRELKHFISSPTYILNTAIFSIFIVIGAIVCLFRYEMIYESLATFYNPQTGPIWVISMTASLGALNDITSPSISLEGKSLWIVRTLPIKTIDILKSKIFLHLIITIPPIIFVDIIACIMFRLSILYFLLMIIMAILITSICAIGGLLINLAFANFNWTNETVAIKQNGAVIIAQFGGILYGGLSILLIFLFKSIDIMNLIYIIFPLFNAIICLVEYLVLKSWGVKKFESI